MNTTISDSTMTVLRNVLGESVERGRLTKTEYGQAMLALNTLDEAKAALNYALSVLESIKAPVLDDLEIDVLDEPVDFGRIKAVLAKLEGGAR